MCIAVCNSCSFEEPDPLVSDLCIVVFDPMCDDCIQNLQIQVGETPGSPEECHDQLPGLCTNRYGSRTTSRQEFEACRDEASCGRFEGDAPPTCEAIFTVDDLD